MIPNKELIDELCWPSIKYINEKLDVETLYCCQGRDKSEMSHGLSAYISFKRTDKAIKLGFYLIDNVPGSNDMNFRGNDDKVSVYFRGDWRGRTPTHEDNIQHWNNIEKVLKEYEKIN